LTRNIVEAARQGDQGAFIELVGKHGDRLFGIAYRMLRDTDRARDALQDALVLAWRDIPTLRDVDRFEQWIQRILTNVCIAQASAERRRSTPMVLVDGLRGADEIAGIDNRDQIDRGFRRIEPKQRAVLVLHHYLGYSPTEISQVLGVPAGTVRSRLHNAHRAMRAALDAESRLATAPGETA
jgi:RNA polymerase sigma-70 factor (ECF subfamily)